MDLLIGNLTLKVVSTGGDLVAKIRACDREFFQSWLKKVYKTKASSSKSVTRYGFLVPTGGNMQSPKRKEIKLYPRYLNDTNSGDILIAFSRA